MTYRLRFFFDAGSGICLWSANDAARDRFGYPVEHSLLPISPALSALLDTLLARFDAAVDWANPTASALPAETAAFHTRASEALALLRRELGPAFHIEDDRIAE